MLRGKVKWFDSKKGYGFLTVDGGGRDVFCHHSAILATGYRCLEENQAVEFDVVADQKGQHAVNVQIVA